MPRPRKVVTVAEWPRQIIMEGSSLTVDRYVSDGREYISLTTVDGAATNYPVASLERVRPHIWKAVFGA